MNLLDIEHNCWRERVRVRGMMRSSSPASRLTEFSIYQIRYSIYNTEV